MAEFGIKPLSIPNGTLQVGFSSGIVKPIYQIKKSLQMTVFVLENK